MTVDDSEVEDVSSVAVDQWDKDTFVIPHRPERISHDSVTVRDENGDPVMEDGEPKTVAGGSVIEGYCRFDLTVEEYDREGANEVLRSYEDREDYEMAWWEDYNALLFDTKEMSPFEVRVLPERVAVDVKASTTSESVRSFAEEFVIQVGGEWRLTRTSEKVRA